MPEEAAADIVLNAEQAGAVMQISGAISEESTKHSCSSAQPDPARQRFISER
jgi:hypothetical protein